LQLRTRAGKNLDATEPTVGSDAHGGTIACVSGYLINMVDKSIKLISPCPASRERPLGYKVYAETTFSEACDVDNFIGMSIERFMPKNVRMDRQLAFRDNLQYVPVEKGFHLKSPHFLHKVEGESYMAAIGEQIHAGGKTLKEITSILMQTYNVDIFSLYGCVGNLFDRGFLSDGHDDVDEHISFEIDGEHVRC